MRRAQSRHRGLVAIGAHRPEAALRAAAAVLPADPERAALQAVRRPFKGSAGRSWGRSASGRGRRTPRSAGCITDMQRRPAGGAEIECTLLFADIRGSTGLAEHSSATDFAALLHRFYAVGSQAIIDENGIVDKFVGDEVVALFIPVYRPPSRSPRTALRHELLAATGHGDRDGPWLNIGIGIHSGVAFVGTVAVVARWPTSRPGRHRQCRGPPGRGGGGRPGAGQRRRACQRRGPGGRRGAQGAGAAGPRGELSVCAFDAEACGGSRRAGQGLTRQSGNASGPRSESSRACSSWSSGGIHEYG